MALVCSHYLFNDSSCCYTDTGVLAPSNLQYASLARGAMHVLEVPTNTPTDAEQAVAESCCNADYIMNGLTAASLCTDYLALRPGPVSEGYTAKFGKSLLLSQL